MTRRTRRLIEAWERDGLMRVALDRYPCDDVRVHSAHVWRPDMHSDVQCPGVIVEQTHQHHKNWRCPICDGGDIHTLGCAGVAPCPCACNSGGFCGGCGHAGCGGRR